MSILPTQEDLLESATKTLSKAKKLHDNKVWRGKPHYDPKIDTTHENASKKQLSRVQDQYDIVYRKCSAGTSERNLYSDILNELHRLDDMALWYEERQGNLF